MAQLRKTGLAVVYHLVGLVFFTGVVLVGCVNECDDFGTCSQICTTTRYDTVRCSCMEGFLLGTDYRSCSPIDPQWKLICATSTGVGYISELANGGDQVTYLDSSSGSKSGVTYDSRNNLVYWIGTDPKSKSAVIVKKDINSLIDEKAETVVDTGLYTPSGIAFDWITGNIYFTDRSGYHIGVCSNETGYCTVVFQNENFQLRDVALHPNEGLMFFTEWGVKNGTIFQAGMDGSRVRKIITTDTIQPNGITLDQGSSRLFWVDGGKNCIESSRLDGSDRQMVISTGVNPIAVDIIGDRIFWIDSSYAELSKIESADKYNGSKSKWYRYEGRSLELKLALFHVANQPLLRSNPCKRKQQNCSHICTLTQTTAEFKCFCPTGMVLQSDNRTCVEPQDLPKLVVAYKGTIKTMRFNTIGKNVMESIKLPNILFISAIVYNPINHTLILGDNERKRIYEYNINQKQINVLINDHLDMVTGMDIDAVGENLYWVDTGKQTIEAMSFRTKARTVIKTGIDCFDILIVPKTGSLYVAWRDVDKGKVSEMNLIGYERYDFMTMGTGEPIALAYDKESGNILWADQKLKRIESASINGRSTILTAHDPPSDVVKYRDEYFWTEIGSHNLKHAKESERKSFVIKLGSFESNLSSSENSSEFKAKLTVIDRDLSTLGLLRSKHECSWENPRRKPCSHMCLLSEETYFGECRCPEGLTLDKDGVTCKQALTCGENEFSCENGSCIARGNICDDGSSPSRNVEENDINNGSALGTTVILLIVVVVLVAGAVALVIGKLKRRK